MNKQTVKPAKDQLLHDELEVIEEQQKKDNKQFDDLKAKRLKRLSIQLKSHELGSEQFTRQLSRKELQDQFTDDFYLAKIDNLKSQISSKDNEIKRLSTSKIWSQVPQELIQQELKDQYDALLEKNEEQMEIIESQNQLIDEFEDEIDNWQVQQEDLANMIKNDILISTKDKQKLLNEIGQFEDLYNKSDRKEKFRVRALSVMHQSPILGFKQFAEAKGDKKQQQINNLLGEIKMMKRKQEERLSMKENEKEKRIAVLEEALKKKIIKIKQLKDKIALILNALEQQANQTQNSLNTIDEDLNDK